MFQDFEGCLRTEVDLVEDDIRLVLDEYNSVFVTYELQPGIYSFKDNSEAVFNILQPKYPTSNIVIDEITMKSKLVVRVGIIAMRFYEKSFFSTILGFNHGWHYKHYNKRISQKKLNLSTTNKVHLKCDVIDGSVIYGIRQADLCSFV